MATRQYIGARYVPKFDGVHSTTKSYEPLTIVTDAGETTSYTSKKFVPVGVELSDNEYWAITGTLSGALLDLQGRMTTAENDIDTIENEIDKINKKPACLLIGDSWGTGTGSGSGQGWIYHISEMLPNYELYSNARDGAGYTRSFYAGGKKIIDLVREINIGTEDPENVKLIIIEHGSNDYVSGISENTIHIAMEEVAQYIASTYPNAKVIDIIASWWLGFDYRYLDFKYYFTTFKTDTCPWSFADLTQSVPKKYYIDATPSELSSGHLSSAGYKIIAENIRNVINGCDTFTPSGVWSGVYSSGGHETTFYWNYNTNKSVSTSKTINMDINDATVTSYGTLDVSLNFERGCPVVGYIGNAVGIVTTGAGGAGNVYPFLGEIYATDGTTSLHIAGQVPGGGSSTIKHLYLYVNTSIAVM